MTQKEKLIELLWDNHNDHPGAFSGMTDDFEHEADYLIANGVIVRDKGEWIPKEDSFLDIYYECSCCGGEFYLVEGTPDMNDYFFCPTCGADMREEAFDEHP